MSEVINKILGCDSFILALIYTAGHICIAMAVVSFMTGASLWEAGSVEIGRASCRERV